MKYASCDRPRETTQHGLSAQREVVDDDSTCRRYGEQRTVVGEGQRVDRIRVGVRSSVYMVFVDEYVKEECSRMCTVFPP